MFDGVLQTVLVGVAVAGVALPRTVVVWQDPEMSLRVTPAATQGGGGLTMTLTTL